MAPSTRFPDTHAQTLLRVCDVPAWPGGGSQRPRPFHGAIRSCQAWATTTRVACDGVVFADTRRVGYHVPDRLCKLKDVPTRLPVYHGSPLPTIDYSLCSVPGHSTLFELLLRGGDGVLQSLHAFRHRDDANAYRLPVLLQASGVTAGQVVELGVRTRGHEVTFPTMQVREAAKQPNFLWAAMDIVHAGYSVDEMLQPNNPKQAGPHWAPPGDILARLCILGPLRQTKNAFTRECLTTWGPPPLPAGCAPDAHPYRTQTVWDVGGGQGGDCHHWVRTPGLRRVDVVDVDGNALEEYARRLATTYNARQLPDGTWCLPDDGRVIALCQADARTLRGLSRPDLVVPGPSPVRG